VMFSDRWKEDSRICGVGGTGRRAGSTDGPNWECCPNRQETL
jgi:hypothetical protein